jgi:hypothetical protein
MEPSKSSTPPFGSSNDSANVENRNPSQDVSANLPKSEKDYRNPLALGLGAVGVLCLAPTIVGAAAGAIVGGIAGTVVGGIGGLAIGGVMGALMPKKFHSSNRLQGMFQGIKQGAKRGATEGGRAGMLAGTVVGAMALQVTAIVAAPAIVLPIFTAGVILLLAAGFVADNSRNSGKKDTPKTDLERIADEISSGKGFDINAESDSEEDVESDFEERRKKFIKDRGFIDFDALS